MLTKEEAAALLCEWKGEYLGCGECPLDKGHGCKWDRLTASQAAELKLRAFIQSPDISEAEEETLP